MPTNTLSTAVLISILVGSLLIVGASTSVVANDEYTITVPGSVDVPTREVPVFGGKNITAIAKADTGETVTVNVDAPSGNEYTTVLVNSDQDTVDFVDMEGDDSGEFDLGSPRRPSFDSLEPGSYTFAVENDTTGAREVIHPLVIKGFDVEANPPDSADPGDDVEVDVTVTRVDDSATNNYVEVVIADEEQNISARATNNGGTYTATLDTSSLDSGTYNVYATVRGNEEIYGGEEVIYGISDNNELDLNSDDSDDDDENTESGGGGGAAPPPGTTQTSGTTTADTATTDTTTVPNPQTDTTAVDSDDDSQPPDEDSSAEPETSGPETSEPATETTNSDVITPNTETAVTTDTRLPGFEIPITIVLMLVSTVLLRARLG